MEPHRRPKRGRTHSRPSSGHRKRPEVRQTVIRTRTCRLADTFALAGCGSDKSGFGRPHTPCPSVWNSAPSITNTGFPCLESLTLWNCQSLGPQPIETTRASGRSARHPACDRVDRDVSRVDQPGPVDMEAGSGIPFVTAQMRRYGYPYSQIEGQYGRSEGSNDKRPFLPLRQCRRCRVIGIDLSFKVLQSPLLGLRPWPLQALGY